VENHVRERGLCYTLHSYPSRAPRHGTVDPDSDRCGPHILGEHMRRLRVVNRSSGKNSVCVVRWAQSEGSTHKWIWDLSHIGHSDVRHWDPRPFGESGWRVRTCSWGRERCNSISVVNVAIRDVVCSAIRFGRTNQVWFLKRCWVRVALCGFAVARECVA